jgi:hypothetical protein
MTKFTGGTRTYQNKPPFGGRMAYEMPGVAGHGPALLDCVDFIQLSKIRGAVNGKVETSRGRKSPVQD